MRKLERSDTAMHTTRIRRLIVALSEPYLQSKDKKRATHEQRALIRFTKNELIVLKAESRSAGIDFSNDEASPLVMSTIRLLHYSHATTCYIDHC